MQRNNVFLILPVILLVIFLLAAGCASTPGPGTPTPTPTPSPTSTATVTTTVPTTAPPAAPSVMVASSSKGNILVDGNGTTLYYFGNDVPGSGTSACTASTCAALWPPFFTTALVAQSPLVASDFQTITRSDGLQQITYRGWPLYYYANDVAAGDVKGDGVLNIWYVMKPDYSVVIMKNTNAGTYLADGQGKTLYVFANDQSGVSTCTGSCIAVWPAFKASAVTIPSGLAGSSFTTIQRTDGTTQSTYLGMPLYYYSGDSKPGDTLGKGIGGVWSVAPLTALPRTTVTTPPTTTIPSGGGGYGGY